MSNVVPVRTVTYPAAAIKLDTTGFTVPREPMSAPECCACDAADGANVSGAKTVSEYSAEHPAESLGVAGSSLLCSGSDLTAPPLIMLHF